MSYVDLKHLLAELAIGAMRRPEQAGWVATEAAYAESASADRPGVGTAECLRRAAILGEPHGWQPSEADLRYLVDRGLLADQEEPAPDDPCVRDGLIALAPRFRTHLYYLQRHAPRLLVALTELRASAGVAKTSRDIAIGTALFNAGLFFECHEWFEGLWKATTGAEKGFYQGIVQAAAAFYHFEKGNRHGCRTLMRKGRLRLTSYPAHYLDIDLGRFKDRLAQWAEHFDGGARPSVYPRIDFVRFKHLPQKVKGAPRG